MSSKEPGAIHTNSDGEFLCLRGQQFGLRLTKSSSSTKSSMILTSDVALAAIRLGIPEELSQNPAVQKFLKDLPSQALLVHPQDVVSAVGRGDVPPLSGLFLKTAKSTTDESAITAAVERFVKYSVAKYTDGEPVSAELIQLLEDIPEILVQEYVPEVFVEAWNVSAGVFNARARRVIDKRRLESASLKGLNLHRAMQRIILPSFTTVLQANLLALTTDYRQQQRDNARRFSKKVALTPKPKPWVKGGKGKVATPAVSASVAVVEDQPLRANQGGRKLCTFFARGEPCKFHSEGKCKFSHVKEEKSK
jgi:hypothetical protein